MTSRVTPCLMSLMLRPSSISDSVAQLSMLMKPGATARPSRSMMWVGGFSAQVADGSDAVAADENWRDVTGNPTPRIL